MPASSAPLWGAVGLGKRCPKDAGGFSLVEVLVALGIVVFGLAGVYAMVMQAGRLTAAAEEEALAYAGLDQRIDQLRNLGWPELTGGSGITGQVWTAAPATMTGIPITQEDITIAPFDVATAQTLTATWPTGSAASCSFSSGAQPLSTAAAVKVTTSITWTGRRSGRRQNRTLVTVISRGGISKSALP